MHILIVLCNIVPWVLAVVLAVSFALWIFEYKIHSR
jgi:hypothetical protein